METIHASKEHTPLLENDATSNGQRQLSRSSATFNRQTSKESTSNGPDAPSNLDTVHVDLSVPRNADQETEVSLEEVVQALCSAWQRNRRPEDEVTLDFFNQRDLYIMHLAWKKVTMGRVCNLKSCEIAEALAAAIATEMYQRPETPGTIRELLELEFHMDKHLLAVNLIRNWLDISNGYLFPLWYTRTIFDSDEQTTAAFEFWLRRVDLYDKIRDFIFSSRLQIFLHSLLIFWPISILIVGAKYMECPMSHHLSYLLMGLGGVGCLSVLVRLSLIHLTSQAQYSREYYEEWLGLRVIEFSFLIVFLAQAFHLFSTDPATEPDPNQCVENFYNAALRINYVSIAFVTKYVFVYFIKTCLNYFDASWIFRI